MIPAGYLVALGKMNVIFVFLAGTLWALVGASINYFGGMYLGRPVVKKLIHKYGKYILLNEDHYKQSERYFRSHGDLTTFFGRFIPAVRQLISIPAGIFQMDYKRFLLYTGAGAGAWNMVLISIGFFAGKNDALVKSLLSDALIIILLLLASVIFIYVLYIKKHKKELQEIEDIIDHNDEKALKKAQKNLKKAKK